MLLCAYVSQGRLGRFCDEIGQVWLFEESRRMIPRTQEPQDGIGSSVQPLVAMPSGAEMDPATAAT